MRPTTKVIHPVNYAQRGRSVDPESPWLAHEPVLGLEVVRLRGLMSPPRK
jgi:hypothetical protein